MFACVTFLFFGDLIDKSIQIYGRYTRLFMGSEARWIFGESAYWAWKDGVSFVASLLIIIVMTRRVITGQGEIGFRRSDDPEHKK